MQEVEMTSKAMTRWVVVLTAIGSLMAALDTLVVSTALNRIRLDLGASVGQLEWTVNAYNLSFAVLLITGAALGDRYGRRRLFAIGLGVFAVASATAALAPNVGVLIGARALQGAGSALIVPLGLALLSAAFPAEKRGAAIGIFSAITGDLRGQRTARRRGHRAGDRLAVDLLGQRPDRARDDPARTYEDERELWARHRPRPARARTRDARCTGDGLGAGARQPGRLG
jgi:Major Facilitator Superfamily